MRKTECSAARLFPSARRLHRLPLPTSVSVAISPLDGSSGGLRCGIGCSNALRTPQLRSLFKVSSSSLSQLLCQTPGDVHVRNLSTSSLTTSPKGTMSTANVSATEAAFEAAMFGDLGRLSEVGQQNLTQQERGAATCEEAGKDPPSESLTAQGSAAVERNSLQLMEKDAEVRKQEDRINSAPTTSPVLSQSGKQHKTTVLSEEAFERALHNDLFGVADSPVATEDEGATATDATEMAVAGHITSVFQDGGANTAQLAGDLSVRATTATARLRRDSSATDAAFERTLHVHDEAMCEPLHEATTISFPAYPQKQPGVSVVDGAQPQRHKGAFSSPQGENKSTSSTADISLEQNKHNATEPFENNDAGSAQVPAAPVAHTAVLNPIRNGTHGRIKLVTEYELNFEEDKQLFETDKHQRIPLFASFESTSASSPTVKQREEGERTDKITTIKEEKGGKAQLRVDEAFGSPLPPPPPTVSMTCPFNLEAIDDDSGVPSEEGNSLYDALFGLIDHHTSVVTYCDPADRVESCMPLLDRASKLNLFYESGWLLQLQEQERGWIKQQNNETLKTALPTEGDGPAVLIEPQLSAAASPAQLPSDRGLPAAVKSTTSDPSTHREVVGRNKVLRCLVYRFLRAPDLWWDQVLELVSLATEEAKTKSKSETQRRDEHSEVAINEISLDDVISMKEVPFEAENEDTTAGEDAPLCEVLTEQSVRRAMFRIFGTRPLDVHFFSDALQRELAQMYRGTLQGNAVASSANFDTHASNVSTPQLLSSPTTAPVVFSGPAAAWKAFVLTHRLDCTWVCAPHVKPFSYGEFRPTITSAELMPLRYCNAAASWSSPLRRGDLDKTATSCDPESSPHISPQSADASVNGVDATKCKELVTEHFPLFANMNETEQNAFLFGEESAQLLAQLRSSDGIFLVYGQAGVTFEEEDKWNTAAEAPKRAAEEEDEVARLHLLKSKSAVSAGSRLSLLENARAEEMARVRLYDVDRVVLELTNTEGRHSTVWSSLDSEHDGGGPGGEWTASRSPFSSASGAASSLSAFLRSVAFPTTVSSLRLPGSGRGRGLGGRLGRRSRATSPFQLHLQNGEDVQLAALWRKFVNAPTSELIDNLVHVQLRATELMRDAATDLVVQKAFWLLFYGRDEVRAVTHPRRTYETVWRLHDQLVEILALSFRGSEAGVSITSTTENDGTVSTMESRSVSTVRPSFEVLSPYSQVSYTCFACAHLPYRRCNEASAGDSALPLLLGDPQELYQSLKKVTAAPTVTHSLRSEEAEGDTGKHTSNFSDDYQTLSDLQQLAIGFCFPQNPSEAAEMTLRHAHVGTAQHETAKLIKTADGSRALIVHSRPNATKAQWADSAHGQLPVRKTEVQGSVADNVEGSEAINTGGTSPCAAEETHVLDDELLVPSEPSNTAAAMAAEAAANRAATQQQVRDAVEASIYRCLCSLRAAGVLRALSPPSMTPSSQAGDIAPLFTAAQQAAIQRAIEGVVASFHTHAEDDGADQSMKHTVEEAHENHSNEAIVKPTDLVLTSVEEEDSKAPTLFKTRKGLKGRKNVDAVPNSLMRVGGADGSTDTVASASRSRRLRQKKRAKDHDNSDVEQPVRRKRGRPPRKLNPDGTYTKSIYVHSPAYLEKKRRQQDALSKRNCR